MREIPEKNWKTINGNAVLIKTGKTLTVNDKPRSGKQSQHVLPKNMSEREFQRRYRRSYFTGMTNKEVEAFIQNCIGKGVTHLDKNGGVHEIVRIAHDVGMSKQNDGTYRKSRTVYLRYNKSEGVHGFPCEDERYERGY